jgi:hypothetical protein
MFIVIRYNFSNRIGVLFVCISLGETTYLQTQIMVPILKNQQFGLFCFLIFHFSLPLPIAKHMPYTE